MSVTSVALKHTARLSEGEKGAKDLADVYQVITSAVSDDYLTVLAAAGVPKRGDAHPTVANATCRRVTAERQEESKAWLVTAEYSTSIDETNSGSGGTEGSPTITEMHPHLRPPKFRGGSVPYQKPLQHAIDDEGNKKAILNSAGQPFDDMPEIEAFYQEREVTTNVASYVDSVWDPFVGKTNSATFRGKLAETVRVASIGFTEEREIYNNEEVVYYPVTVRFEWNPEGWKIGILNAGYYQRGSEDVQAGTTPEDLIRIKDANGEDVVVPMPLDDAGYVLTPTQIEDNEAFFIDNRVHYRADFSELATLLRITG